jgi:hypothetical protein
VPKEGQTMRCKVLYDYDAEDETELTIKEGKLFKSIRSPSSGINHLIQAKSWKFKAKKMDGTMELTRRVLVVTSRAITSKSLNKNNYLYF